MGLSAYNRLREEPFELLLTDIVMPEMDGIELARRATELDPEIKVMFITGFAAVALNPDNKAPKDARDPVEALPFAGSRQRSAAAAEGGLESTHARDTLACPLLWRDACRVRARGRLPSSIHSGHSGACASARPATIARSPPLDKSSGEYSGFDIDLAHSLGQALGVRVEFVPTSWRRWPRFRDRRFRHRDGRSHGHPRPAKIGFFTSPYLREGKTPIARCADKDKFETLADIDRPGVTVIANPGGGNERFDRTHLHAASIVLYPDNLTIFDRAGEGRSRPDDHRRIGDPFQQKLHPGVLCAIHPDTPFDFAEKAYWMRPRSALKASSTNGCTWRWRTGSSTRSTRNGSAERQRAAR